MLAEADKKVWQTEGEQKNRAVREMFSRVAPTYDLLNSFLSLNFHHKWRKLAVGTLNLKQGDTALDLCSGTGDFLKPLRAKVGPGGRLVGLDFCEPMLSRAQAKDPGAVLILADAKAVPVSDASVDGLSVGWGLRNVDDLDRALAECVRVLKPGGRFACLDMARPRGPLGPLAERAFHVLTPMLGRLFGQGDAYKYLPKSTATFVTREELATRMRQAGFVDVGWRDLFFGNICLHTGVKP